MDNERFVEVMEGTWVNPRHIVSVSERLDMNKQWRCTITTIDGRYYTTSGRAEDTLAKLAEAFR